MHLWDKYDLSLVKTVEGLALLWKSLANDLVEKDLVNIENTAELLSYFYKKVRPTADTFLAKVITSTNTRIKKALDSYIRY